MTTYAKSVDVAVQVDTAYDQGPHVTEFPQFVQGEDRIDRVDDTHACWVASPGGGRSEFDAGITEQHPDERVARKVTSGPEHAGVGAVHRIDDTHARVHLQRGFEPVGAAENAGDTAGAVGSRSAGDLGRCKTFVEQRGAAAGQWRADVSPAGRRAPRTDQ